MTDLAYLAPGWGAGSTTLLPSSRLWLSADRRQPGAQHRMLRFLEPCAATLPLSAQTRLRALTGIGEHGAALRLLARRIVSVVGDAAMPDASATALTLAMSVFGDDRAALELAVLACTLAARADFVGDPAALGSQRLAGIPAWALGSLIKRSALDWHEAIDRLDHLREGDPLSSRDKEIGR